MLSAGWISAQAVSEFTTEAGLPVAVVETPGGDLEHLGLALLPAGAVPEGLAGGAVEVVSRPPYRVALLSLSALQAPLALAELAKALGGSGVLAAVAVGPLPARELAGPLGALAAAGRPPQRRERCMLAEGRVEVVRGSEDAVELAFAAPGPADPRFDLLPVLAAWLQGGLRPAFPGLRVDVTNTQGCTTLTLLAPAPEEEPRTLLLRLRRALGEQLLAPVDAAALAAAREQVDRRRLRWSVDGRGVAADLVARLAAGGSVAGSLASQWVDAETLGALARELLSGHAGSARLSERERRGVGEFSETLDNGASVAVHLLAGEVAAVAVALAGVTPGTAAASLAALARRAAERGWFGFQGDALGVATAAVAAPAGDAEAALELLAECLTTAPAGEEDPLAARAAEALGLARGVRGEALAVSVGVPEQAEEAGEAAAKFLSGLPATGVVSQTLATGTPLRWTSTEGAARILAVVELPPSAATAVAGELLRERLRTAPGVVTRWQSAPGRLALLVGGTGEGDVPALDSALAAAWQGARQSPDAAALARARETLLAALWGDLLAATARQAASRFLPFLARPELLAQVAPEEVATVVAGLPSWEQLLRFASGPAPPPPAKPRRGVRESRPRR